MTLPPKIKDILDRSVLCWLATVSKDGIPNVSPKECFCLYQPSEVVVANIGSPQTERNIISNPHVALSFVDIFTQKGAQLKGKAKIITQSAPVFKSLAAPLLTMTKRKFPFKTVTHIAIESVKPIVAPSYWLFPETTEAQQIEASKKAYGI